MFWRSDLQIQFASFSLPLDPQSAEQAALNHFLRSHTVMRCHTSLVPDQARWAILVEYGLLPKPDEKSAARLDYKEVLSPEDFAVFDRLRQTRKRLAEAEGMPAYAIATNEQLAQLARMRPSTKVGFMGVEGLGQAKADKYAAVFLAAIGSSSSVATDSPL